MSIRNSGKEGKLQENFLIHPKSAPIKPNSEALKGTVNTGLRISSMYQEEEILKQKKIQQKTYFQELTRQIIEKNEKSPIKTVSKEPDLNPDNSKKNLKELPQVSFAFSDDKKYSRYQKKYEIENHVGITENNVFGGVFLRDEALMLKIKKLEEQKEMRMVLNKQIEEKTRKNEEK